MSPARSLPLVLFLVAVPACKRQPELDSRPRSLSPSGSAAAARPTASAPKPSAATLTWPDPKGWERSSARSPMRLASYRVPKVAGDSEDGELTVFHFGPGQGGTVASNLERWEKQFTDLGKPGRRSERTVKGMSVHLLEIERGTFSSAPMPGQPGKSRPAYGMIAAIVETPAGPYFFKLIGPVKTTAAAREGFQKLLDDVSFGS